MNGKKLSAIGLALVCALSLAGNLFLYQQNKDLTAQLAEQTAQTQELTQQVEDYHAQISSLQAQLEALQASRKTQNTDEMDVYATDNVIVDTPQAAEAEQGTAGAASEAQTGTDYGQQQQSKPTPPPAPSKPATPPASSKPTTPPASSKPDTQKPPASKPGGVTQGDVNDLLNDVLGGGGGGSSSKPSGGGGNQSYTPGAGTQGGNNLGGNIDPDDVNW